MQQASSWQYTIALVVAIAIFGGATVVAIVLGREVPPGLWAIDGGLANAVVAHAGFFTQRATARDAIAQLGQATQDAHSIARQITTTTTTPGEGVTTTVAPAPQGGQQ